MEDQDRSRIVTPGRMIAVGLLALMVLGGLVVVALSKQPGMITLNITGPVGKDVYCDVVIDGRAKSHIATVPVSYVYQGRKLSFAVIPVDPPDQVTVGLTTNNGSGGNTTFDGVKGTFEGSRWASSMSIGGMTPRHVDTMRAAAAVRQKESLGTE